MNNEWQLKYAQNKPSPEEVNERFQKLYKNKLVV